MDAEGFSAFLTEDAAFRFGNQPAATGRAAVTEAVRAFFSTISGLKHELVREWAGGGAMVVEGRVTYTRHDGSQVTLPFVDVLDTRGSQVSDYRIYIDAGPLFAPPAEAR
jgi:ketosteroid isomerase-like protein